MASPVEPGAGAEQPDWPDVFVVDETLQHGVNRQSERDCTIGNTDRPAARVRAATANHQSKLRLAPGLA